jgi:hypothetical protein
MVMNTKHYLLLPVGLLNTSSRLQWLISCIYIMNGSITSVLSGSRAKFFKQKFILQVQPKVTVHIHYK